jgi:Na+-transporting NADH:ubiquinone oxidoreductase subunit C
MPRSFVARTIGFAAAVCVVCAVLVSGAAVALRERQETNVELDRRKNVLTVAGMLAPGEDVSAEEVNSRFGAFEVVAIDLRSGAVDPAFSLEGYSRDRMLADASTSFAAPPNNAQIPRLPTHVLAYRKLDASGQLELLVLPVEGKGLWSTMLGFLALGPDLNTIRGLTYYSHGETPGLGGEVDNPRWKALWPGREAFDDQGDPAIVVTRGQAGTPEADPHRVDGLAGATLTSRGVSNMLQFWLGDDGYGPYLASARSEVAGGQVP